MQNAVALVGDVAHTSANNYVLFLGFATIVKISILLKKSNTYADFVEICTKKVDVCTMANQSTTITFLPMDVRNFLKSSKVSTTVAVLSQG